MKTFRYFAYGSNMCQKRLEDRVGKVIKVGIQSLSGYSLQFNCTTYSGLAFANITKSRKGKVWGVTYILTANQVKILDSYEGLYYREVVQINNSDTIVYIAYVNPRERLNNYPSSIDYIRHLLVGYKENNMTRSYQRLQDKVHKCFGVRIDLN